MLSRKVIATVIAGAAIATGAQAQENVSAARKASSPLDLISSQTGNIQLRNYVDGVNDGQDRADVDYNQVTTQVRANLTVNTFDDVVSHTLTLGVNKYNDGTNQVTQRRPRLFNEVSVVDGQYFKLSPYLDLYLPNGSDEATRGDLGINPEITSSPMEVGVGTLELSFVADAKAIFNSQKEDADARTSASEERATGVFGLVADNSGSETTYKVEDSKGTTFEVIYIPTIKLDLDRTVKGLSLSTFVEYYNTYTTVIDVDANTGERTTVYQPTRKTWSYFNVSYRINETLKFDNYTALAQRDLYGASGDQSNINYQNLAMLSYTMY